MKTLDASEVIDSLGLPYFRGLSTFGALPDEVILALLNGGVIKQLEKGEFINRDGEIAEEFQVVLVGKIAFYKHFVGQDVLTRYFQKGEQIAFDLMIGLIQHDGVDVATETSQILEISSAQFFKLHVNYPAEFGLLMINLARELSREISMLEDVIGKSRGWLQSDKVK